MAEWVDDPDWSDDPETPAPGLAPADRAQFDKVMSGVRETGQGVQAFEAARQAEAKRKAQADEEERQAEDKRHMAMAVSGMTGGQNLATLSPEKQEEMQLKGTTGALGELITVGRGAPFVGGHIDELSAAGQSLAGSGPEYDAKVKEARGAVSQAEDKNPWLKLAATLGLNAAAPASMAGRLALNTAAGASEGVGAAPTMKDAPRSGMIGAGVGLGTGVLGEAVGAGGRFFGNQAQRLSDATHTAALEAETKAREAAVKSAIGSEGGVTASAMKMWDRLEDAMFNPSASEETKRAARDFINSPEGQALYNQVLGNYAGDAPRQMGRLVAAKEARAAAEAANNPDLIRQAADATAEGKLNDMSGVTKRLTEMARRYIPPAVGGTVAGAPGAAAGAFVAGSMGKPGTIMSNMIKSPSMYRPLLAGEAVVGGAGKLASSAAPAAAGSAVDGYLEALHPPTKQPWESFVAEQKDWEDE